MASEEYDESHVPRLLPIGQMLPLNSRKLMAPYVRAIAESMGLPTKASADEVLQLIEGKLAEEGREPRNVQVIIQRPTDEGAEDDTHVRLSVVDESGVIAEARVVVESGQQVRVREEDVESTHAHSDAEEAEAYIQLQQKELELNATLKELEEVRKKNEEAEEVFIAKDAQIERLMKQLQREKERYGQVWRMNCEQLMENDAVLASKDEQIVQLQERLHCMQSRETSGPGGSIPPTGPASSHSRSVVIDLARSNSGDTPPEERGEMALTHGVPVSATPGVVSPGNGSATQTHPSS